MAKERKTIRNNATILGADLANELQVQRTTILAHMHRLRIEPRYGFGKQVLFTEGQAQKIRESVELNRVAAPLLGTSGPVAITSERQRVLVAALKTGATSADLITDHGATIQECEVLLAWWRREQNQRGQIILSAEIIAALEKRVGRFTTGSGLVTLFEEAILVA